MADGAEKPVPRVEGQPKRRGCVFWALTVAAAGFALAVLCVFLAFRHVRRKVLEHTDTEPVKVPVEEVTPAQARALDKETTGFIQALERGEAASLELTAQQINALIATAPQLRDLRGKVHVSIDGDRLVTDASIPLDAVPGMAGRYLNGRVELGIRVQAGELDLDLFGIAVKSRPVPKAILEPLAQSMVQEARKRQDVRDTLARVERLEVRDGRVIIRARPIDPGAGEP